MSLDALLAPTVIAHTAPPGVPPEREGIRPLSALVRAAFPDGRMLVKDRRAEGGQRHASHDVPWHPREWLAGPAATRPTRHDGVPRPGANGRFVASWSVADTLGRLLQLGVSHQSGRQQDHSSRRTD